MSVRRAMEHIIMVIGTAVVLFASTNIDDVFVLLGFFADPTFRLRQVVLGQYIGIAVLYGASVAASLISLVVSPAYVGLLALAPIAMGSKRGLDLWKGTLGAGEGRRHPPPDMATSLPSPS
jgi:cadmium resistance protein CadD (predicted permease)